MITWNKVQGFVDFDGLLQLKLKETTEYLISGEQKISIGKVEKFTTAPEEPGSIWMLISNVENAQQRQYISCLNWFNLWENGAFTNSPKQEAAYVEPVDTGAEPADNDLPF